MKALLDFLDKSGRAKAEVKFKGGQVEPGFSGGPLLNLATGYVMALVVATRDRRSDLGGWAIEFSALRNRIEDLGIRLPAADPSWTAAAKKQQRRPAVSQSAKQLQFVSDVSVDFDHRIQNFITEYLGTYERPVPFGGRDNEFAQLNNWLNQADCPYPFLAAHAGRGKSALLVRWIQRILEEENVGVVFYPVSVRFGTNLASVTFHSLLSRLASVHNERSPGILDTSIEIWREMIHEYLKRPLPDQRRLLLVIDGIDEAADWTPRSDLFPSEPPPGLHIVLSGRSRVGDIRASGWLRSLGWDQEGLARSLDLNPLTLSGVRDVIHCTGFPFTTLGADVDIAKELYRLSEGDPLLVRLYVDDLWNRYSKSARLRPVDLSYIRPGLDGYFERWWDDQCALWGTDDPWRRSVVRILLNLLSFSLGPLSQEDLLELAPRKVELDTWTLSGNMRYLERLVIGDGRQQGYVYAHPRLANYFAERLSKAEWQAWRKRFLDWGERTLNALKAKRLTPENTPVYLVQYYGAHLDEANADPDRYYALVGDAWLSAWDFYEGFVGGFLNDVDRCRRAAENSDCKSIQNGNPAGYLGYQVACALVHSSVNSMLTNIPPALLSKLVETKHWSASKDLAHTRLISDVERRVKAITALIPFLTFQREEVVVEALKAAREISDAHARVTALTHLLPHLSTPPP